MNAEIIVFLGYFVILFFVGLIFFFNGSNKNQSDYFLGGRSMGPWVTAMSAQASDMSAWLLDTRLRLRPDLDRHRPCTRHCG